MIKSKELPVETQTRNCHVCDVIRRVRGAGHVIQTDLALKMRYERRSLTMSLSALCDDRPSK